MVFMIFVVFFFLFKFQLYKNHNGSVELIEFAQIVYT